MANTQTSVPLFVANAVLTAAQQNISAGTGTPVFATTVTRDASFGGSNKALAEGQLCYLESTNVVQYYDGAAWATVGPSTAGGLVFVNSASFSAVSTVSFAANTFTSTYDNYRVMLNITSASANSNVRLRFRAAGTDNTTSNYAVAGKGRSYAGANVDYDSASDTGCYLYATSVAYGLKTPIDIFGPKLAQSTSVTNFANGASSTAADGYITIANIFGLTTSFDSATIFATSGTITGDYRVYGYANS